MRRLALAGLVSLLGLAPAWAETPAPAARTCAAVTADLDAARSAGHVSEAAGFYTEAEKPGTACEPKALFCLGRSLALAHVEAAYKAAEAGKAAEAANLFEAGHRYGEPWPLLVGLGDAAAALARQTHDPKLWAEASLADQKAVAALDEPQLCADEPPRPEASAYDMLVRKMALATLLSRPLAFFHSKCAPCSLGFLTAGAIDAAHPRVLPVTFDDSSPHLTPEGASTAHALVDCALSQKWPSLKLSVHTDARGTESENHNLSERRIDSLKQVFAVANYKGTLETVAAGKTEPLAIDDPAGLTEAEVERANRRVELLAVQGSVAPSCTAQTSGAAP